MRWAYMLGIVIWTIAIYSIRLRAPYVADDHFIFYRLQHGGVFGFASLPPTSFFRPLISLHYYLDYLAGMPPLLSHGLNLAWHTLCALLLYVWACWLLMLQGWNRGRAEAAAHLSALLFAVLPANVEAVAWFASRADMVAAAGALGALLLLMRYCQSGRLGDYLGALMGFAVGLFCKESLLTFPLMVWVWLRFLGVAEPTRKALPFWGVLTVYLILRTAVVGGVGAYPEAWQTLQRPWLLLVNLAAYLAQMGMPAILYGFGRDAWDTALWSVWGVGVVGILYTARVAASSSVGRAETRLLTAFVLLALMPVLIFKPSPFYFLNSRYTYLASAFALVGVSAYLTHLLRYRVAQGAIIMLLLAYSSGAIRQVDAWREAGETARRSILSLRDAPTEQPLLLLSVPDHFHGAYIWRAGFPEAVALLLPERASQPIVAASRFTMRLNTKVQVNYADGVATLSSPSDIFLRPEHLRIPSGDEPIALPDKLIIHQSLIDRYYLMAFQEGRFVKAH
ncbi:MAG: hypothetical protein ACK4ME_05840 [Fimbriimonadales bacterium]